MFSQVSVCPQGEADPLPLEGTPWRETPLTSSRSHCSGRHASYWNAFLLFLLRLANRLVAKFVSIVEQQFVKLNPLN